MKHEKLKEALSQVSDDYIAAAAEIPPKKRRPVWLGAVAAILAAAVLAAALWSPLSGHGPADTTPTLSTDAHIHLLSAPNYPKLAPYPTDRDNDAYTAWQNDRNALHSQPEGYADSLRDYFKKALPQFLGGTDGQNAVCSPINIYMALAMLAETTAGSSRQQLLALLDAESIEALRTQAKQVWQAHYNNDGLSTSILSSSLWLDDRCTYNEETTKLLTEQYYASVFRGDLGSTEMNTALHDWLNQQTGGLLQAQADDIELSSKTVLALATTVFYQVQWQERFFSSESTQGIFHGTDTARDVTYMHKPLSCGPYFWGQDFGAVYLLLEDGSKLWLILPDEGVTPEALLEDGQAADFVLSDPANTWTSQKEIIVNLSVPKFDITADMALEPQLQQLGITNIFTPGAADFSPIIAADENGYVNQIQHAVRIAIDEAGVTAAAFTVVDRYMALAPSDDEIDFVLDRPFLFVITSQDNLPLFAGIVNQP